MEPMIFVRQVGAAIVLVTATLLFILLASPPSSTSCEHELIKDSKD